MGPVAGGMGPGEKFSFDDDHQRRNWDWQKQAAEEFARWVQSQDFGVSTTRCYSNEVSITYAPMVNWLSAAYQQQKVVLEPSHLRELTRILPNILREFPNIEPPQPIKESWQRFQFFETMMQILLSAHAQASKRLLLVIDDLQWCDSETLEWLLYLLRFDHTQPLLIIGTLRIEEVNQHSALDQFIHRLRPEGKLQEVELSGLNPNASTSLAAHILSDPLDEATASRLFSNTSGNPLFIVEVARAWATHQPELSERLQGVIAARLSQFSGVEAEVIDAAATIGREFTWNLLSITTQLPEEQLLESLGRSLQETVFREQGTGTFDFLHDQIREVAYQRISIPRQRILHRRIAEAIIKICTEAEGAADHLLNVNAAQIAMHYEEAGSPYQAFQYYAMAAGYASRVYAHQVSETLYASAIR
jgi:predicted ATPase